LRWRAPLRRGAVPLSTIRWITRGYLGVVIRHDRGRVVLAGGGPGVMQLVDQVEGMVPGVRVRLPGRENEGISLNQGFYEYTRYVA